MKEKLQVYALIAEIIGSIAVVVSLIVVAVELNQSTAQQEQNTVALQLSAYQDLMAVLQDYSAIRVQDREFNDIMIKAQSDPQSLTLEQRTSAVIYFSMIMRHASMAYFQYEKNALDQEQLDYMLYPLINLMTTTPMSRFVWRNFVGSAYDPDFATYVESKLVGIEWPEPGAFPSQ